ncbi:mitochondrial ribosomal protein subunit L51 [Mycena floridula]|nr:mitochondrial ribosomal protein subunit L51 [Mycena floridula]
MRQPPVKAIFRAKLGSAPSNGHSVYLSPVRKLVFEYTNTGPSSANARTFLLNRLEPLARENPHVEMVVRMRHSGEPIVRGFYVNQREKVIPLNGFEVTGIQKKVQLLLDSSGAKIKSLKKTVESKTESARGIWSGVHATRPSL